MTFIVTEGLVHAGTGKTQRGTLQVSGTIITDWDVPVEEATIIEAEGCSLVPLLVDTVFADPKPPAAASFDLVAGNPATFAVIRGSVRTSSIRNMLVVSPQDLTAVVVHGQLVARHGRPQLASARHSLEENDARLGVWRDPQCDMVQYLSPNGRYSETRNGRRDAFTGRFWLTEDRITYLDDAGFWAFGQYHRGILHHAGFVLDSSDSPPAITPRD